MYVINIDKMDKNKIYQCNGVIASWLIHDGIPLMGKTKNGEFCFSKTKELESSLANLPFYLRVTKIML